MKGIGGVAVNLGRLRLREARRLLVVFVVAVESLDLSGYDAMLFKFATDVQLSFYMRTVPVPLSIAWFASSIVA